MVLYTLHFKLSCVYFCQLSCVYCCSCIVCTVVFVLCVLLLVCMVFIVVSCLFVLLQLSCVYYCSCLCVFLYLPSVYCCTCLVCIVVILCVLVLCVSCCFYFRCQTAGQKSVFGRSCDRIPRHRYSWFPCVYTQMLSCFPRFQVAAACFSCNPSDLSV